ncbi:MAG: polysaccharide deacetylase family protein [Porphyromonas sp.]|nr:polysaccharide deacetylase family protein [Porphyromonas sp.]
MIIEQPPQLYRQLFPGALWRVPRRADTVQPSVYLTFDDGPIPEVTPWVLDLLAEKGVKGTFFCVGENVWRFRSIFDRILDEGHAVGNHTYHHLQGLPTPTNRYVRDALMADRLIQSPLFRPPHGHLGRRQLKALSRRFHIVMWDVVTRDYSKRVQPEEVLAAVKRYTRDGSIIVFHDSLKSERNLRYALPLAIDHLLERGYRFETLPGRQLPQQLSTPLIKRDKSGMSNK